MTAERRDVCVMQNHSDTELNYELFYKAVEIFQKNDSLCTSKFKLFFWVLTHLKQESDQKYYIVADTEFSDATQSAIAKSSGVPLRTVERTMSLLQECNPPILIQEQFGRYCINPIFILNQ